MKKLAVVIAAFLVLAASASADVRTPGTLFVYNTEDLIGGTTTFHALNSVSGPGNQWSLFCVEYGFYSDGYSAQNDANWHLLKKPVRTSTNIYYYESVTTFKITPDTECTIWLDDKYPYDNYGFGQVGTVYWTGEFYIPAF